MAQSRDRGVSATTIGVERMKARMREKDLNQEELAIAAQVSLATVKRLFGFTNVELSTIEVIAIALNLEPEDIVDRIEWKKRTATRYPNSSNELIIEPELACNTAFYVERPELEIQCYNQLLQPGALIRIKAPQLMGKTWFIEKVLTRFDKDKHYRRLDLEIDRFALTNLQDFYQWFCKAASEGLDFPIQLSTYWKGLTPNGDITNYFQKYLLKQIAEAQQSLILVLDKVDRVFESSHIANSFCELLRGWNEKSIKGDAGNRRIWEKLRLVVIHSTEVYGSLDIHYSPLGGVGIDFKLSEFNHKQVQELAQRYQLPWQETEACELMRLVGGHPYLVHLAISKISYQSIQLEQILNEAYTEVGIYADHLRQLAIALERSPELKELYEEIVLANQPIPLKSVQAFKLDSMGLIQIKPSSGENMAAPRCRLYAEFFCNHFSH